MNQPSTILPGLDGDPVATSEAITITPDIITLTYTVIDPIVVCVVLVGHDRVHAERVAMRFAGYKRHW
jgi:hypothetical protein